MVSNFRTAIIGAGLSAAFVKSAIEDAGLLPPVIYAPKQTPKPQASFFLRSVPPRYERHLLKVPIFEVFKGTADLYEFKQWGNVTNDSSFRRVAGPHNIESWQSISGGYNPYLFQSMAMEDADLKIAKFNIVEEVEKFVLPGFDAVFTTTSSFFPPKLFGVRTMSRLKVCYSPTRADLSDYFIFYNGEKNGWHRFSRLWGWDFTEWRDLKTNRCNSSMCPVGARCSDFFEIPPWNTRISEETFAEYLPSNLHPIGRYALWDRMFLADQAYQKTLDILSDTYGIDSNGTTSS